MFLQTETTTVWSDHPQKSCNNQGYVYNVAIQSDGIVKFYQSGAEGWVRGDFVRISSNQLATTQTTPVNSLERSRIQAKVRVPADSSLSLSCSQAIAQVKLELSKNIEEVIAIPCL